MKKTKFLTALLGCLTILIYFTLKWTTRNFGSVTAEQIIWNLSNGLPGDLRGEIYKSCCVLFLKAITFSGLWILIIYKIESILKFLFFMLITPPGEILRLFRLYLQKKIEHVNNVNITLFLCALSLLCFATQLHRVDREFNVIAFVKSYLTSPDEDFFAQNYSVPNENEIVFKNKKDLVVVLSESLESSFFDSKISSAPLQSRLASIKKDSAYFDDMFMPDLSAWTIAAAATWHFGIPLKLPSFLDKN
jgi:hypothetical protein